MKANVIVLSDLHFGIKDTKSLFDELNNIFIPYINEKKFSNCIIAITGDTFDKRLSLNDEASFLAIQFIDTLYKIAKSKDYQVRIILGTKTHDLSQLNVFDKYVDNTFKIIRNVSVEKINDFKILYIPEEYVENPDEYYSDAFSDKYDFILGHGTLSNCAFKNQKILSEKPIKTAPIFDSKVIKELVRYYAIFGHIHIHKKFNKILIPGSFTRWCHGEESDKGFLHIKVDTEKDSSKYIFIKNENAPEYKTLKMDEIEGETLEDKIKTINSLKKEIKNIRISLDKDTTLTDIHLMKDLIKDDDNIKLETNVLDLLEDDDESNEYSFLTESNLPIESKIFKFIKRKYSTKIKKERILEYIAPVNNSEKD